MSTNISLIELVNNLKQNKQFVINDSDLFNHKFPVHNNIVYFFQMFKYINREKVLICDKEMLWLCQLLNINKHVVMDLENFEKDISEIKNIIKLCPQNMIMLISSVNASTLISSLHDKFPYHTYIDITKSFPVEQNADIVQLYTNGLSWTCMDSQFNCCLYSERLINILIKDFDITHFVETGTFMGQTTKYIAGKYPNIEVHTVEYMPDQYKKLQEDFKEYKNIYSKQGNSSDFLKEYTSNLKNNITMYYLDAHSTYSHPLLDELKVIQEHHNGNEIIIIDDFYVPNRDMGFDCTNTGQRYDYKWVENSLDKNEWFYFYKSQTIHPRKGTGQIIFYHKNLHEQMKKFITYENSIPYSIIYI